MENEAQSANGLLVPIGFVRKNDEGTEYTVGLAEADGSVVELTVPVRHLPALSTIIQALVNAEQQPANTLEGSQN